MMRKKVFYIIGWSLVVLGLPLLGIAILCDKLKLVKARNAITDNFLAFFAWCLLRLTGSSVSVTGLDNIPPATPLIFISNHQSHFDSAVLLAYLRTPKSFIATSEAKKIPILSTWFDFADTIYMEKNNIRQNYHALEGASQVFTRGRNVVIYPEGIISSGPALGNFKRGGFKMAFKTGVAIVPVVIDGTWEIMGPENNTIQPAQVSLKILPPLATAHLDRTEQKELPNQIYNLIASHLEYPS